MKVCLEFLYHYCCDSCKKWWSIADIKPAIASKVFCPHCGTENTVDAIEEIEESQVS